MTEELLSMLKPKDDGMKLFEYEDGCFLNLDHVVSFSYDLIPITPELSDGDIFGPIVFIQLPNGEDMTLSDLPYVAAFGARMFASAHAGGFSSGKKDFGYFVEKALAYHQTVKENEKK